ncbi:cytidine deaminase-like protein [Xylariaceae sp. FL0662B]|nr:cytidine deaminase-like protein [Xylariaceae sp. FL0662B]
MAGHKISGYISSLWQALFASFIHLFTRIFRFTTTKEPPQDNQQRPSATSTSHQPDSASLHAPNPNPTSLQHHHGDPSTDLELGLGSSSQDDTTMAPSKKRGGQKRGGNKANGNASASQSNEKANPSTSGQYSAPPPASRNSTPAGVTHLANQRDTKANSHQPDGQKPAGSRRGGRNRGRSSPTKQLINDKKENGAPLKAASKVAGSQSPALKPLVTENKAETQKPGSRSQNAIKAATPFIKPTMQENIPPGSQVEQLRDNVDRLTLDDIRLSGQPPIEDFATPAPATETPAVPVPAPIVVALPLTDKPVPPKLTIPSPTPTPVLPGLIEPKTEEERAEREYHLGFMREALDMGSLALNTNETPVGCVLVYHGRTIAKGMNATNVTRNGTRHAEFMALSALLSRREQGDVGEVNTNPALDDASWGDVDPRDGHIYPYGQKLHPAPVVDRSIISECVLYVTVEPCVMCASLLRQLGVKKVYFGAVNDKFGGTGGVFRIHLNSKPAPRPAGRPYQNGYGPQDVQRVSKGRLTPVPRDEDEGDGGNVERGYPVEGGYLRDDAVSLLRRFYVQENGRAPQPRKKEGRAARLFAMEKQIKNGGSVSELSDGGTLPDTPVDPEPIVNGNGGIETNNHNGEAIETDHRNGEEIEANNHNGEETQTNNHNGTSAA